MALMGGVIRNASTHATLAFANACITGTFTCYSTDGSGIWNNLRDNATTGYEGISITCSAGGFNPATVNLVSSDIAFYPGIGYGYWKVVELTLAPVPETCFTGDTMVTMADGSRKQIAHVTVGDYVLGKEGTFNRVAAIDMPELGDRRLYALNDNAPFITHEHPLLTERGWAAINPSATAQENPTLPVETLVVGDTLYRLTAARIPVMATGSADAAEIELTTERLVSMDPHHADPATQLYNLLLDQDHTYFANGYLVHNKTSTH